MSPFVWNSSICMFSFFVTLIPGGLLPTFPKISISLPLVLSPCPIPSLPSSLGGRGGEGEEGGGGGGGGGIASSFFLFLLNSEDF